MEQQIRLQANQELTVKQQTVVQMQLLACPAEELTALLEEYTSGEPLIECERPSFEEPLPEMPVEVVQAWDSWEGAKRSAAGSFEDYTSIPVHTSLRDALMMQIRCLKLSKSRHRALLFLVDELTQDGYLPTDILDGEQSAELSAAMELLQHLEPSGVGARSLRECLEIQLRRAGKYDRIYQQLLEHLEDLAERHYQKLSKLLHVAPTVIQSRHQVILSLNPRPGAEYSDEATIYIFPDVTVTLEEHEFHIQYNRTLQVRTAVREEYRGLLADQKQDPALRKYIRTSVEKSAWLNRWIEQREKVVCQVCREIILQQEAFFFQQSGTIAPLTLSTIAKRLGVSISTVSRACAGKYMQTPLGTFPFSYFFSNSVGEERVSAAEVRKRMLELIDQEDPADPYSDQQISELLLQQHQIQISRRTIAKYRNQLHISDCKKRKTPIKPP